MRIPILCYQPMHIDGNDYRANDLKALASDLRRIAQAGFRIVPLRATIDAWLGNRGGELEGKVVALTCDNGADFDYLDLPHPAAGTQRSVLNTLRDFEAGHPGHDVHVTSFVVASPQARAALDAECMIGEGWWTDGWWKAAIDTGLMHLGNHSWDHNHEALPRSFSLGIRRGTFLGIDSDTLADREIRQAAEFLDANAPNPGTALFSYPYGEVNSFLPRDYFPTYAGQMGIAAAFTTRAGFLEPGTGRWEIPRFVCGRDWTSPEELGDILDAAADPRRPWVAPAPPTQLDTSLPSGPVAERTAPARAGNAREFREFLEARVEPISGWLHAEAALLTAHLANAQRGLRLSGPTLEIGVYKGKYLSVLYELSRPGEMVVGVDLFVGSGNTLRDVELVRSNIARACGEATRLKLVVADSMELTREKVAAHTGGACRFISVDAGHTRELVFHDLEVACPLLQAGGIIAMDDAFNHTTPGVMEGIAQFFVRREPEIAPFAMCYNKLFATTPDFHDRYLRATLDFLDEVPWLPMQERTIERRKQNLIDGFTPRLFGYEVIPFL